MKREWRIGLGAELVICGPTDSFVDVNDCRQTVVTCHRAHTRPYLYPRGRVNQSGIESCMTNGNEAC